MTHPIIKTENYLLVVDESEIKEGDWLYGYMNNNTFQANKLANLYINSKKIIYHLPLKINAPTLEGVPLLPPLEDEAERVAESEYPTTIDSFNDKGWDEAERQRIACEIGYNKAKEKYKYTEADLKKAIDMAWILAQEEESIFSAKEKIIQSLQQPKYPVAFECEMVLHLNETWSTELGGGILSKPKTITNPQGLTQLVGKYIY